MKEMGMFTLIGKAEIKVHGKLSWELRCKCGTVVTKTTSDLNKLVSTSNCGCVGRKRSKPSLSVGDKFGMLTIKSIGDSDKHDKQMWNCQCECGNTCTKTTSDLRKAKIGSCGCVVYKIHGKANTPIYTTWEAMHQRCNNIDSQHYQYYGGRGITICQEWHSFKLFYSDMGDAPKGHVIDRIDPNGNYEKDNCRWVTRSESSYNTRKQKNNTSGRTGVRLDRRSNIWYARIDYQGKSIHLGSSYTFEGACKLREAAELLYFGYTKE